MFVVVPQSSAFYNTSEENLKELESTQLFNETISPEKKAPQ